MAETILVTGGAGYIGSHACKALAAAGYLPIVYDNLSSGHRQWSQPSVRRTAYNSVQWGPFVEASLHDRKRLIAAMQHWRVAAVMHFAARSYVGESVLNPALYYENNVGGTLVLLDAMREARVNNIVFSSTCAVYGIPDTVPIRESTKTSPLSPYGDTKLTIERMLEWYSVYDLKHVALRYFNAAGADPDGMLGEDHSPETHLIPLVIRAMLGRSDPIEIFGTDYPTPDGTAIRDYIHVSDLADAHVLALGQLLKGAGYDTLRGATYNLGTGSGYSVRQIIAAVERVSGRLVPCRETARRAGDPPELVADPLLAQLRFDWHPQRSDLDTIVRTALAWEEKRVL